MKNKKVKRLVQGISATLILMMVSAGVVPAVEAGEMTSQGIQKAEIDTVSVVSPEEKTTEGEEIDEGARNPDTSQGRKAVYREIRSFLRREKKRRRMEPERAKGLLKQSRILETSRHQSRMSQKRQSQIIIWTETVWSMRRPENGLQAPVLPAWMRNFIMFPMASGTAPATISLKLRM